MFFENRKIQIMFTSTIASFMYTINVHNVTENLCFFFAVLPFSFWLVRFSIFISFQLSHHFKMSLFYHFLFNEMRVNTYHIAIFRSINSNLRIWYAEPFIYNSNSFYMCTRMPFKIVISIISNKIQFE